MKLTFLGAAREVTGSCYLLECDQKSYLVDCGMEQGPDIYENQSLSIPPTNLTAVFLTHAHIDHSGMLPYLYRNGFRGKVYLTKASSDLCKIMLMDSAHIQEFEAEWRKRKAKRGSQTNYEPIYNAKDVEGIIKQFIPCEYDKDCKVSDNITIKFIDAGHLLGSSSIQVVAIEDGITKTLAFSGDIGNDNKPIIKCPHYFSKADYVIMESTYGDRLNNYNVDYVGELANIIQSTFDKGGNVVIPSFAVGRMQELLYFLRTIKQDRLVKGHGDFPVYIDSPLAVEATNIFNINHLNCYDQETKDLINQGINPIIFDSLKMSITADESKLINENSQSKVILSASGMCEAGRIRHHLKHNLWREESTIVFVGYQVEGTLGRIIINGAKSVKLFNEIIQINALICQLKGTSSHADRDGLLVWASKFEGQPQRIFVTHGEDKVAESFAQTLYDEQHRRAIAPYNGCIWDLINDECLFEGNKQRKKNKVELSKSSPEYNVLLSKLSKLEEVIARNKGGSNRDLKRFAKELQTLCDMWDR